MKFGSVFNPRGVLEINYKISSMDAYQNVLYTGDEKGTLYRYQLQPDQAMIIQANQAQSKSLTKSRIDQIKVFPQANSNLLVLSDQTLFFVEEKTLKGDQISKEKVSLFALNEFSKINQFEIVIVTKKKEGFILQYNQKAGKFECLRERFLLPDIPVTIAFIGNLFYFGISKKNYSVINLDDKQLQVANLIMDIGNNPYLKATDKDEILIITTNNIGIFIGKDGQMKQKSTIQIQNKSIQIITIFKQYLIVLFDNLIQVFNLLDSKPMSDIQLQSSAKCITQTSNHLFYGSSTEIIYLYQTPPEQQIQDLLKQGRVEDALQVFQQYNQNSDASKNQQLEQLKLDCGWALIRQMQFQNSLNYILQTNFEPRDFICLFPDYYYAVEKLESVNPNPSQNTISLIINKYVQEYNKGDPKKSQELKVQARDFLIEILEKKRAGLTTAQYAYSMKDKLTLLTSSQIYNQNQWHAIPCEQLLELIDFALIKAYLEALQLPKLKSFLSCNQIYCLSMYAELQAIFQNNKAIEQQQGILARFYESFNKIDLSLEVWRTIGGDSLNQQVQQEACEETTRILKQNPDKNRIFKFILWVLKKQFKTGIQIFYISESIISPDQMLKFLDEQEMEQDLKRKLKEKYLEVLVLEKQTEEERFHTQLAYSYIDSLFNIYPKDMQPFQIDMKKNQIASEIYQSLKKFLKNPNSKYNSSSILEKKVKDSWMIGEVILLYGREKRHEEALSQLLNLGYYDWAEKYCCEYTDNLLTKLFKKYKELYFFLEGKQKERPTDQQTFLAFNQVKITINNFMKKYATHSQLNALEVLEMIPENWILADQGEDDGLFQFLNSVISHTLHQKRSTKAAFHLSDMDLLNVECLNASTKQANVRITSEKKCAVCSRSIGEKVFVVYPNAVIAHHTCIKSNTVCPQTDKDFEKYFKM
ncbi:unnamed protein product [Paramecium pentaurelia]|uniref:CNH domain-containing protein n=1 Tax=Paramecium pentaurelia TaxID=43138 RepID=A0A8S1TUY5_9CILI|nr:unnamed protein product [Paramecium pentaurelia]